MNAETYLKLVLRVIGTSSLLALIFVAAPYSWMDAIHEWCGMGRLPDEPVVGYLARSTSALYALLGGLFWVISFDLRRHRQVLLFLGAAVIAFGVALWVIDACEGMPRSWAMWEGPFTIATGAAMLILTRAVPRGSEAPGDRISA